jgi:hypothetical protein
LEGLAWLVTTGAVARRLLRLLRLLRRLLRRLLPRLLWRLLLGLLFFLPPILAVNTCGKVEAVRIKGVFRNRPSAMTTGTK